MLVHLHPLGKSTGIMVLWTKTHLINPWKIHIGFTSLQNESCFAWFEVNQFIFQILSHLPAIIHPGTNLLKFVGK